MTTDGNPLNILFLEPYYGGSHRSFADGLVCNSQHTFTLETMPDRFWKWRMRGAAFHFARSVANPENFDLVLCSDMLSVTDLKALWANRCPPIILYMHENQLSYPVPKGEQIDYHFAFTNISSGVAADWVLFNSETHRDAFLTKSDEFLRRLPEYRPQWMIDEIRTKCSVLYPGCDLPATDSNRDDVPLIVWNHRWEFDKDPALFFDVLKEVARRGRVFTIAVLGENFQAVPKPFIDAKDHFSDRMLQYGYVDSKVEYRRWLARGSVAVSTATQENFGISVVEAIHAGCLPLLPERLSYPELIPEEFHELTLYKSDADLVERLDSLLLQDRIEMPDKLKNSVDRFSWKTLIDEYDLRFSMVAERRYK